MPGRGARIGTVEPSAPVRWLLRVVERGGLPSLYGGVFIVIFVPAILLAAYAWVQLGNALTEKALERREAVAELSALTLKERLDRLVDVGQSLATRVQFRNLIARGEWEDAVAILSDIPETLPYIERMFITDLDGTLMADHPPLPQVRGKNFAYRDWYLGASRDWQPYVSVAYTRLAEPRHNVIAVAVPIERAAGEPLGLLVIQVRLDTLVDWTREIDVGNGAYIYVIDQRGGLVAHPDLLSGATIRHMGSMLVADDTLRAQEGIITATDEASGLRVVTAIKPLPGRFGWTVLVQQPYELAFELRSATLTGILVFFAVILLLSACAAWLIASILHALLAARNQLTRQADELAAVNKELEAFSYSVSHDLRAPLRAVDGFAQATIEDFGSQLPDQARGYLERVSDGARRMGQLIDDLLAFSRLSRAALNRKPVDMAALVRDALQELTPMRSGREIEVRIGQLPRCEGDPMLLRQVWINLLSNALKYTRGREPAIIEIGATQEGGDTAWFVRDNGAGFDMRYVHKVFGVFQRLHRADEFEGTGVGLAIVQRVVHRHGGQVRAEGQPGHGATFTFTLGGGQGHDKQ